MVFFSVDEPMIYDDDDDEGEKIQAKVALNCYRLL